MNKVIVYSRDGCHLCEDMLEHLVELNKTHTFELIIRDVDSDPNWLREYHTRVPVLEHNGTFVCEYFLDEAALLARLSS